MIPRGFDRLSPGRLLPGLRSIRSLFRQLKQRSVEICTRSFCKISQSRRKSSPPLRKSSLGKRPCTFPTWLKFPLQRSGMLFQKVPSGLPMKKWTRRNRFGRLFSDCWGMSSFLPSSTRRSLSSGPQPSFRPQLWRVNSSPLQELFLVAATAHKTDRCSNEKRESPR